MRFLGNLLEYHLAETPLLVQMNISIDIISEKHLNNSILFALPKVYHKLTPIRINFQIQYLEKVKGKEDTLLELQVLYLFIFFNRL